jgi:hypothetical protein
MTAIRRRPVASAGGRWPPASSVVRGCVQHSRLTIARRFAGRRWVQRHMRERALESIARWYLPEDDPVSALHAAERSVWSQNGEDGLLEALLQRVGAPTETFVEIGAADGTENCTRALAERGWRGVWFEADDARVARAKEIASAFDGVDVRQAFVTSANVRKLLEAAEVGPAPDVLVLDIDGSDLWVLRALLRAHQPRVLVVEYNAAFPPGVFWTRRNRASYEWDETYRHGASLDALHWAAARAGYRLVACDSAGVNAFFVRADVAVDAHLPERPLGALYRPLLIAPPNIGHPLRVESACPPLSGEDLDDVRIVHASLAFLNRPARTGGVRIAGVRATIQNDTAKRLTSAGPTPLRLSAHLLDAAGNVLPHEAERNRIAGGVAAGRRAAAAGVFTITDARVRSLRLALVQDGVAWLERGAVDVPLD